MDNFDPQIVRVEATSKGMKRELAERCYVLITRLSR